MKKIKILHTEWSDGWGGQEIRIINEMLALRERGVEVYLACREHSIIKTKAIENNIKVFVLPFRGNTDFKTLFALIRIIKNNNIDIVNTHSGKDTWVGGIAAKLSRTKFIRTRHLSNKIKSSRFNFINELADYVFTTGESIRTDMVNFNRIKESKIISIPTGIDENIFNQSNYNKKKCREKFNILEHDLVFGIVAVLRQFKRHDIFINVAKQLIDKFPELNLRFFIAGDGPQKENIQSLINKYNLNDKIILLGHVSNVPEFLAAIDIFMLTSDSKEGVPQSVMQALLMSKATISTNAGSTSDLFFNDNFILVDVDNIEILIKKASLLIENKKLREEYSKNARGYIEKKFSMNSMSEKIYNIYKKVLIR